MNSGIGRASCGALLCVFWLIGASATGQMSSGGLSGIVVDEAGAPVAGAEIELLGGGLRTTSAADGSFALSDIAPGSYTVHVRARQRDTVVLEDVRIVSGEATDLGRVPLVATALDMGDVIVTATRNEREILDVSNAVNTVPRLEIDRRMVKTSAEALREETGVFVQKTNHGGGSAILRGLSSNQILILVDGIRLNNSTYRLGNHQYLTTVDSHMLEGIEVVRGPASVLYGSDAMGGTINLITARPEASPDMPALALKARGQYASADGELGGRVEGRLQRAALSLLAGVSFKDFGDLRRGRRSFHRQLENATDGIYQRPSGYRTNSFDAKLVAKVSRDRDLIVAYQGSRQGDVPRYDKYENNGYAQWLYDPQERDLAYLAYEHRAAWRATLSFHRQQEGRKIQRATDDPVTRENDETRTWGASLQLHPTFGDHLLTAGGECYHDDVASDRYWQDTLTGEREAAPRGRYPDGARYTSTGLFAQDEITLGDAWVTTLGLRYSYFHTRFSMSPDSIAPDAGDVDQSFQALTGSLGLVFRVTETFALNANVGQAFRAPNLSDMSKLGESKGDTYEVPNPDLEPEQMLSADLGCKLMGARLELSGSAYASRITDLIASADATFNGSPTIEIGDQTFKVKSKQNTGTATLYGVELSGAWSFRGNCSLHGQVTTTYGQNTTLDEPVGGVPPTFGILGVKWESARYDCDLYSRMATEQTRLSSDDLDDPRIPEGGTPGWAILSLRGGVRVTPAFELRAAVENIVDLNYREHGSGINGPGRNLVLGFQVRAN